MIDTRNDTCYKECGTLARPPHPHPSLPHRPLRARRRLQRLLHQRRRPRHQGRRHVHLRPPHARHRRRHARLRPGATDQLRARLRPQVGTVAHPRGGVPRAVRHARHKRHQSPAHQPQLGVVSPSAPRVAHGAVRPAADELGEASKAVRLHGRVRHGLGLLFPLR